MRTTPTRINTEVEGEIPVQMCYNKRIRIKAKQRCFSTAASKQRKGLLSMPPSDSTYKLAIEQMQHYPSTLSQADRVVKFCVDNGIATVDTVNGKVFNRKGGEYKCFINRDGYCRLYLGAGKRKFGARPFKHRVIAYAIWGDKLFDLEVNHINENKQDNRAANLELVTRGQNMQHSMNGDKNHMTKLTPEQVLEIRRRYKPRSMIDGGSALAREFGVSPMTVFGVINFKTWRHV